MIFSILLLLRIQAGHAQGCPSLLVQLEEPGQAMTCGVPCQLMELTKADECRFDISACGESVPAGTSCPVACRSPFFGEAALASCPPGNTNRATVAEWTAPDCDLFASDCTKDPGPLPDAYVEVPPDDPNGVTTYGCAAGFAGNAVARCVPDDVCQSTLQYFGCEKTAACAAPIELIGCELDVTGCSDVQPGGSCEVKCRDPYAGWPSWALCKPDNVNSEIGLLVVKPECTLLCDDPPNEPEGYIKVSGGNGWACAPGYGGEADWTCVIDSVCASKKVLSGCSQLARCILPVENSCMYDFTECIGESAAPGSSCKVHCKRPYQGNSTSASCPLGNTDPLRELDWEAPVCTLFCAEVANVPVRYLSHPYLRVYGGWQCASGYAGVPMITCGTDLNCNPQLQFAGCSALLPCDPPTLTAGEQCSYQHACISVRSGDSCEVTCRPPYVGGIATATCPPNNTLLGQKLNWAVPDCNLECPMPNPLPAGYLSNGLGPDGKQAWICAPRWKANPEAKAECNIHDGDCVAAYTFSGCVPERECAVPHDAPCSVDWSQCHNVFAGETCEVSCGPSFTGNTTDARCPAGNIDPTTPLEWTFPGCVLTCQDPVDPPGYVKTRFMCATNYSGSPSSRCAADFLDQCNPTYSFSGCNLRVPCAPPRVGQGRGARSSSYSAEDQLCMFDFSECQSVPPGGNCTIRCGSDYLGRSTIAYCPSDNTDPNGELVYLEPICSLKPCEMNVPAGYIETPCGWVCDEGYIGEVSWYCAAVGSAPGQCRSELVISGCTLTVECAPLFVNDTCRTNASQCMSLQPGQGCNVTCAEPYTGGQGENATWAYCPGSTTRTGQQPVWGTLLGEWAIDCDVECALPDPIPVGYVLSNGRWLCDVNNQYSGAALAECIVNDTNCEPEYVLSGCFPTTPCDFPSIDSCQHDVSACPSDGKLLSGTSCEVKCLSPYMTPLGEPHGTMECRDPNIDPLGAVWTPPSCILGCSEPSSQTGYRNVFGEWQCAPGYRGPGAIWSECVVDETSCVAFPRLFGCEPYVPCLAPSLTPEQQCMIDLENGFCNGVDPGEVCTVYCKTPYAGDKLGAGCPADNIDPAKVINWLAPVCHCPVPIPLPEGYWYLAWSTYACAPGYYGQASYRCEIDLVTCLPNVILTGCYPLSPCDRPQVDDYELCKLDFTECQGPIQPGESCNVTCKEGFNANTTYAECPADNTVANFAPDLDLYCGEYTCLSADDWAAENPLPRGYDVGTWRCADGFRGSVSVSCAQSDECGGTLQLFGCVPLMPCSTPRLQGRDLCRYNFSECEDTFSGGFCEFHCVPPFSGRPGRAFCKPDNVDPHTELEFIPPDCSLQCPDPNPVPPGYVKIENCGWQCAPGYDGRPQEHCDVDDDCNPQLTLSGCAREEKCILPPSEMFDPCRFDFSGCGAETPPGSSCEVKCKAPFSGQNFLATCPQGNTIPRHPLTWNNESCTLACPMPEPVPLGFALRQDLEPPDSGWICSQGYVGQAEATCMQSPGCGAPILRLSGCDENVPCKNPAGHNQCEFESFCGPTIAPGASCETRCKFPYEGNSSMASCPNPNTQRDGPADWEAPDCNLMCPQIAPHILHPNYTLGEQGVVEDVVCAEGAVGAAAVECRINTTTCEAFWHFWGCLMLQPCILPVVHQCRTDVGNCSRVYPGEFCIMSCQEGYSGGDVVGRCPVDNTDAAQVLEFDSSLRCDCFPPAAQAGYELVRNSGDGGEWRCKEGWTGTAQATCRIDPATCQSNVTLSGCVALRHCSPPSLAYMGDPSDCQMIPAGETCESRCAPSDCISGGPLQFICPSENTNAKQEAQWLSGVCKIRCEVCRNTPFIDSDPRPNYIAGTLQFGEAHAKGKMPVLPISGIHGYRVFFADDCGTQVGQTLGYVDRSDKVYECCAATAYSFDVSSEIPEMATQLLIAINSSFGELPFGRRIDYMDLTQTELVSTQKPITSRCKLDGVGSLSILVLVQLIAVQGFDF